MCPAARTRVRMIFARRLAPRVFAKVMLYRLSREGVTLLLHCTMRLRLLRSIVCEVITLSCSNSPQHVNLCTAMSCGPFVSVVSTILFAAGSH